MDKGLIHVYTGDGKGKTTAAIGQAIRAAGYGKKVYMFQLLKGRFSGEVESLKNIKEIKFVRVNSESTKFYYQMNEKEKKELRKKTQSIWASFIEEVIKSEYEIIIIDELMGAISNKLIDLGQVIELINKKSAAQELIMTGRNSPCELTELADYVTEMRMIKHPYQNGIPPRKGIEF